MIVCHSEHSFCTDFSVLELYLADSGKYSRSSGYFMHTENLHTMRSIHTAEIVKDSIAFRTQTVTVREECLHIVLGLSGDRWR